MKRIALLFALVAQGTLASSSCKYNDLLAARFNPLGLSNEIYVHCEDRLYASANPALANNFIAVVPGLATSPASMRPSLSVEFQPASVFNLFVAYQPTLWYGWLGSVQSFPSVHSDWGAAIVSSPNSPGGPYTLLVHQVVFGATLQAKVGDFAVRTITRLNYFRASTHNGDPVFYDPRADLLTPARGWTLEEDAVATWSASKRLILGLDLVYEHALYPSSVFQPGEPRDNPNSQLRLGPLAVFSPYSHKPGALFDAPAFFLLVSYYLEHRWRSGDRVSAAVPYLAAGMSFAGDL